MAPHGKQSGSSLVLVTAAALVAIAVAACSNGTPPGPSGAAQAVEDYFSAFAEGRFRVMAGISTGPAQHYAQYQVAGERSVNSPAASDFPLEIDLDEAEEDGETVRFSGEAVLDFGDVRTTFRQFRVVREADRWVIADYTRDGRPLTDFVQPLDGKSVQAGITVAVDVVFRDPSAGQLAVPAAITNERDQRAALTSYVAVFTSSESGREHAIDFAGPGEIQPGETVDLVLVFSEVDDAARGGGIDLSLREGTGDATTTHTLRLPPFSGS